MKKINLFQILFTIVLISFSTQAMAFDGGGNGGFGGGGFSSGGGGFVPGQVAVAMDMSSLSSVGIINIGDIGNINLPDINIDIDWCTPGDTLTRPCGIDNQGIETAICEAIPNNPTIGIWVCTVRRKPTSSSRVLPANRMVPVQDRLAPERH